MYSAKLLTIFSLALVYAGCATGLPSKVEPIDGFDAEQYLGMWYEIARLDHRFERNMNDVTAAYAFKDNGDIRVLNRGFDEKRNKWRSAQGKAKFREKNDVGSLKVSFFGPFYGGYHVVELDKNYTYALVAGPSLKFLWILSREPYLDKNIVEQLVSKANSLGFDTDSLIWVTHDRTGQSGEGIN